MLGCLVRTTCKSFDDEAQRGMKNLRKEGGGGKDGGNIAQQKKILKIYVDCTQD